MSRLATFTIINTFLLLHLYGQQSALHPINHPSLTDLHITSHEPEFNFHEFYISLIMFEKLPDVAMHQKMKAAGIELEKYAGNNTYLAVVPTNIKEKLAEFNVASSSDWKMASRLKKQEEFKGYSHFVLSYFNIFEQDIIPLLKWNKIELIEMDTLNHQIIVNINFNSYEHLLKWSVFYTIDNIETTILTEDDRSRAFTRSNLLNQNLSSGLKLDGNGISIVIGDDGFIGPHIDLQNRIFQENVTSTINGIHGDQIAGILAGAGNLDPTVTGIVPAADLYITDHFDAIKDILSFYTHHGVTISCTSLADGCNRGYTSLSMIADEQVDNNPTLMHVFSAGNAGEQDCNYGAGIGWGNITGGVKMAKNGIVVGNVTPDDYLVSTSSKGPAYDGRIKPDIVANGSDQMATMPDNGYAWTGGTSAAAPGIAGVIAQLNQAYKTLHQDAEPPSALIKAALLNSSEDLGNKGPDFSYGWGRVNAKRAYEVIKLEQYWNGTSENGGLQNFVLNVPDGVSKLNVMLYWHDASALPVSSIALVNDLDLTIQSPSGDNNLPWILNTTPDPNLLQLPASHGIDHLNNVEQVTLDFPNSGSYVIQISGYAIPTGLQEFYLVYNMESAGIDLTYPNGGELFIPGETQRIYWDAYDIGSDSLQIEYKIGNNNVWNNLTTIGSDASFYDWQIPETTAIGKGFIRVSNSHFSSVGLSSFSIMPIPENLEIVKICPDYLLLKWRKVVEASGYQIYQLGEKYMTPILFTTDTLEGIYISNPADEYWFAVQAIGNNGLKSRRSLAIKSTGAIFNCISVADIGILSIANPSMNMVQNCFAAPVQVKVNAKNFGSNLISFFPIYYQLDDQPVVGQLYEDGLPPGVVTNIEFSTPLPPILPGEHTLKVWTTLFEDEAFYNDTLNFYFKVIDAEKYHIPYIENFDQFEISEDLIDCNAAYTLTKGWLNEINEVNDHIDWKIINGKSNITFPADDQNSNLSLGAYLNLSGSISCPENNGILLSPCFDLTGIDFPFLNFWYSMKGSEENLMFVDLFDGSQWFTLHYFSGNTDGWQKAEIPLETFNQGTIILRFRGIQGSPGACISIDNFSILDSLDLPIAGFTVDQRLICNGGKVYFKDNSYNHPVSWLWSFDTPNVVFEEGTDQYSKNPIVQFTQPGIYSLTLKVANNIGDNTIVSDSLIKIYNGLQLPVLHDFESENNDWIVVNPDNDIQFSPVIAEGSIGDLSTVMYMDNHSYNAPGQEDLIFSPVLDLTNGIKPFLQFDMAYVTFNDQNFERFQVLLSDDCGNTFDHLIFDKSGNTLATAPSQNYAWAPRKVFDWESYRIDLSPYIGKNIVLKFININGFGNNLYLDNILIAEETFLPSATIKSSSNIICIGEAITFYQEAVQNWEGQTIWYFGDQAVPSISASPDPVVVNYSLPGVYEAVLILYNDSVHSIQNIAVKVLPEPISDFNYVISDNTISFLNLSSDALYAVWEFSDGYITDQINPEILYDINPVTWAKLHVFNDCGEDEINKPITLAALESYALSHFEIYPNPLKDICYIHFDNNQLNDNFMVSISNTSGSVLYETEFLAATHPFKLDLTLFPAGIYFVKLAHAGEINVYKVIKQ